MYRIRLHGRGGQGIKTAGRILGSAFFAEGFEVQDAPRYGAERRGAPIHAGVRAARRRIHERGAIARPDLLVIADASLFGVATAGVLAGADAGTALLVASDEAPEVWRERLRFQGPLHALPGGSDEPGGEGLLGVAGAAAAARLVGVIARESLESAIREELAELGPEGMTRSRDHALRVFDRLAGAAGSVRERPEPAIGALPDPGWVDLPHDPARLAAPSIFGSATSELVRTGLWRSHRPVLDAEHCHRCHWVCTTFCPDGAIDPGPDGLPTFDYDHCKGCLVCVAVCPSHAIRAVPERDAAGGPGDATGASP